MRGWVWCVTVARVSPLRPRTGLGLGRISKGTRACTAKSRLMKLSSESTKNGAQTDSRPQQSVRDSVKWGGTEQEALANTPTHVDDPSPPGWVGQSVTKWSA